MGFGSDSFLAISKQNSFGTPLSSWTYLPIISESLVTNIEQLVEESIRQRYEEGPSREGILSVEGDIVMEVHPIHIGHFLRGVLGPASFTVAASANVYTNVFPPTQENFSQKCALPPYTIQVYRDVGSAWQFTDAMINALTLEITGGAFARATASIIARVSSLMSPSVASFPVAGAPWAWDACSISIGDVANADLESFTLKIENNIEGVITLDTTRRWSRMLRTGYRSFGISGTLDFSDQAEYNIFRAQTEQRFLATLRGVTPISSGYYESLLLDVPNVRYTSFEGTIGGPNRISAGFEGVGKWDVASLYAFQATLINSQGGY